MDYNPLGCFNLMAFAIEQCFVPAKKKEKIRDRRAFARSKVINMFCDCTDNFEAERLRASILEFNKLNH